MYVFSSHLTDPSLPDTTGTTVSGDYVKILNNSIKAVTQSMTWDNARQHCEGDGAKLISLQNGWLQSYVELLAVKLKTPFWIGLNKLQVQPTGPLMQQKINKVLIEHKDRISANGHDCCLVFRPVAISDLSMAGM